MNARYAIYFVPEPATPLAALGSAYLGRDGETGWEIPYPMVPGISREQLRTRTMAARRYGLHATLKAPFFLKPGLTERDILYAADRFVLGRKPLTLPRLEIARIDSFFALAPVRETPGERTAVAGLNTFASEAVSFFDSFRAVPSEQEIARREPHKLTPRQRELLSAWGYPYVFDEYRFHITLTDKISDPDDARAMEEGLREYFKAALSIPVHISGVCVCRQDMSNQPFTLLQRFTMVDHAGNVRQNGEAQFISWPQRTG